MVNDLIFVVGKVSEPLFGAGFAHMFEEGGCSFEREKFNVLKRYIKLGRFLA